jgi:hypothetical protein
LQLQILCLSFRVSWINFKKVPTRWHLHSTLLSPASHSTCFGRIPRPSSGAQFKLYSQHLGWQTVMDKAVVLAYCSDTN